MKGIMKIMDLLKAIADELGLAVYPGNSYNQDEAPTMTLLMSCPVLPVQWALLM